MKLLYNTIKTVFFVALSSTLLWSCTKLDVDVKSEITPDNFPKTQEDFIALTGPAYTYLSSSAYVIDQILVQELSGDGAIITANGGNWYDGARYKQLHLHMVDGDHRFIGEMWTTWFNGISKINSIMPLLANSEQSEFKKTTIAEMRTLRAFYYFLLMDNFGGVPIITDFGPSVQLKSQDSREDVFNFIEKEVNESIPDLRENKDISTYSKTTKWMAYALLAKLYINSEVYTGIKRYDDAVKACDMIIQHATTAGDIGLDNNYLKMFDIDNGPQIKDFLFAIPCDAYQTTHYPARYWLHAALRQKYSLPFNPSGSMKVIPEYYDKFLNSPGDIRTNIFLTGKQYYYNGNPVTINTTNSGLDNSYSGPNPSAPVVYQLEFTRNIVFRDLATFETGNDQLGLAIGYRVNKFRADSTSTTRNQNNDLPVFRYADILLTKAEALLRGAAPTMGHTPVALANMVRQRANATLYTTISLDELLDERARELAYEGWRRNDLIRFAKFEDNWGVKTNTDIRKRIFPIPNPQIVLNPLLHQNPSY
ncbi:MAG: RagB/SusD family nutrient uptake outer membrane protein [Bacteroidota bacterium]|nr:RagB/SusD family nutrient uptake outer membrane protein [Bacteroidota bacterium]